MRKITSILLLLLVFTAKSQGIIKESLVIESKILKKSVEYSMYLPYDYEQSTRSYPILYLLHGFTDDEGGWTQYGEVKKIADSMMGDVNVTDMIIAMPDGGVSLYVNSYDGKVQYEDFFIKEFMPTVEAEYRVRAQKRFRAVAGLSMGGHGTLMYAIKYPELFAAAAPLSAAVIKSEDLVKIPQGNYDGYHGPVYGKGNVGEGRLTDHYKANSTLFLVESTDPEKLKTVRWYIDCGDDDFLIKGNMALHALMLDKGIPHEFRVRDGAHNWTYWRASLPEVLKFVSASFHQF